MTMKKSIALIIALMFIGGFVLVLRLPSEKITPPSTRQSTASSAPLSLMQAVELFNQARWHNNGNLTDAHDTFMTALNEARRNGTIDASSKKEETALMICAQQGMRSRVKDLIAAGANPYLQDSDSHDSFWYAENCERGSDIGKNISTILSWTTWKNDKK